DVHDLSQTLQNQKRRAYDADVRDVVRAEEREISEVLHAEAGGSEHRHRPHDGERCIDSHDVLQTPGHSEQAKDDEATDGLEQPLSKEERRWNEMRSSCETADAIGKLVEPSALDRHERSEQTRSCESFERSSSVLGHSGAGRAALNGERERDEQHAGPNDEP